MAGIFDVMASMGDISQMIEKNKEVLAQVPEFLEKWTKYLEDIRDDAKMAREVGQLILAQLEPGRVTPELTAAAAAAAADDPRNETPHQVSVRLGEAGYSTCPNCGHTGCIEVVGFCANCGAAYGGV
jgi:hypothetical protein